MKLSLRTQTGSILVLSVIYIVGLFGLNIDYSEPLFEWLTPFNILFTSLLVLWHHPKKGVGFWTFLLVIGLAGYGVEVAGVHSGVLFGDYHYKHGLGFSLFGVPLIIGLNWILMLYCSYAIANKLLKPPLLRALLTAVLMTCIDFVIEPFAMRRGLWDWAGEIVPLQNYVGWFIISFLLSFVTQALLKDYRSILAMATYVILLIFFFLDRIWPF